jgi:hypothetical protein
MKLKENMAVWLSLLLLAIAPATFAAGYQPPSLLPLIHQLKKTSDFVEKRVDPSGIERVTFPAISKRYLRGLTITKHPKLVYNLRRVTSETGSERDTLYAILPDVTGDACGSYIKATHRLRYVVAMQPFNIAPDYHVVVEDSRPLPAGTICIETPEGRLFFTMALATRVKKPGQSDWQFETK